tara:strand:- start:73 stop:594 length:522 start_codon:yes stop_codon:yes gene_type:complete
MTLTLKQFEQRGQARIYLDMDGVLCDFIKGVKDTTGVDFTSPDLNKGEKGKIKAEIEAKRDFWHNLNWMPGGSQLYRHVKSSQPHILSAYAQWDKNCRDGKKSWIKRHLMIPKSRINLVLRQDKKKFAVIDGVQNILIDDYIKNIREWEAAGGIGIWHTDVTRTINTLKKHGF